MHSFVTCDKLKLPSSTIFYGGQKIGSSKNSFIIKDILERGQISSSYYLRIIRFYESKRKWQQRRLNELYIKFQRHQATVPKNTKLNKNKQILSIWFNGEMFHCLFRTLQFYFRTNSLVPTTFIIHHYKVSFRSY